MFSIVIPVYNKVLHLERSIHSVLNQSFNDFELLLVDDLSDDGSYEKLCSFFDHRIRVFRRNRPGAGGYAARNIGISMAKNNWICFLDADDEWSPNFLQSVYEATCNHKKIKLFTTAWNVSEKKRIHNSRVYKVFCKDALQLINYESFLNLNVKNTPPIWTSVVVVEKDLITSVGMFPEGKCKSGGDVDTWLRLMAKCESMLLINKLLATYHTDSNNMVTKNTTNFEVNCIVNTCRDLISREGNPKIKYLLKRFSNKYLLSSIAKSIKAKNFNSELIQNFYVEVDMVKYLIVNLFRLKFIKNLYLLFLTKKSSFYGR